MAPPKVRCEATRGENRPVALFEPTEGYSGSPQVFRLVASLRSLHETDFRSPYGVRTSKNELTFPGATGTLLLTAYALQDSTRTWPKTAPEGTGNRVLAKKPA